MFNFSSIIVLFFAAVLLFIGIFNWKKSKNNLNKRKIIQIMILLGLFILIVFISHKFQF